MTTYSMTREEVVNQAPWATDKSGSGSPWQGSGAHGGLNPSANKGRPPAAVLAAAAQLIEDGKPDGSYTLLGYRVEISGSRIRFEPDGD